MVDILSERKLFINQLIVIIVRIYYGASLDKATSAIVSILLKSTIKAPLGCIESENKGDTHFFFIAESV